MANIKYSSPSCSCTSAPRLVVHVLVLVLVHVLVLVFVHVIVIMFVRILVILEMTVTNCLVARLVPSAIPVYKLIMIDAVGVQVY
jgi:hypothetical protein